MSSLWDSDKVDEGIRSLIITPRVAVALSLSVVAIAHGPFS